MISPSNYRVVRPLAHVLYLIDLIGHILSLPFSRSRPINPEAITKILLIRVDYIGDILVTTPAMRALGKAFPHATIDVLIRAQNMPLLAAHPRINTLIPFDPPWLKHMGGIKLLETIRMFWHNPTIRRLKEERYDLVIEFHTDPRNILLAWLINGTYQLGHPDRGLGFLLTHPVPYEDAGHIIDRTQQLTEHLGCPKEPPTLDLYLSPEHESQGQQIMKEHWLRKREFICLNPGTGRVNKHWPIPSWSELADSIINTYGTTIAFTGSRDDLPDIYTIISGMRNANRTVVLAGKTHLGSLAELYRHSRAVICTDTGPMHIAKAVGARLVALFGPVNPLIWGYSDASSRVVVKKQTCSFCDRPDCIRKTERYICMTDIKPSHVMAELKGLI